ncbi:hydantoinase oxoprolinase [Fusarium beomiforme]|uniref:Hydantoinase oxoprolinase n=1 Tax=Fusarium beomiforme TaxID=44412 RepID=A0A9P5AVB4_9HYPO|nr:hydantoinase oxoprolinase [Fusarium beomiforme]
MTVVPLDKLYRIGVDVVKGGTNTDAVVACRTVQPDHDGPAKLPDEDIEILASHKSQTTADVTSGIRDAIHQVITAAKVPLDKVISVNIGTTHFINAVVQSNRQELERVAVVRLCGPFCREVPPFSDFPIPLRQVVEGYSAYVDGGLEIDGRCIKEVDPAEVIRHAGEIRKRGISTVVVVGIFSPLDTAPVSQEEQVKAVIKEHIPDADVICSRDIGRVGFIERENAAVLNATILKFAKRTIKSFQNAVLELGLDCPLYLTQNDGTVTEAAAAMLAPIKTFSSGATNSLTGAIFLSGIHKPGSDIDPKESQVIMVDIGGTTSDFAALSPSGFPRQASATALIGGVRTAFSMPEVLNIGLGGGSVVKRQASGTVTVGPLSVGHRLQTEAKCFGGDTLTATDIAVAQGANLGISPGKTTQLDSGIIAEATRRITAQLERSIDTMKTSSADVVLLLVGGGSIIQTTEPKNATRCIRPPFYKVANAVGAAIAKASGEVDRIIIPDGRRHSDIMEDLKAEALQEAYRNGARAGSAEVVELELIPLQYTTNNAVRAIAKAVGELEWSHSKTQAITDINGQKRNGKRNTEDEESGSHVHNEGGDGLDLGSYVPDVSPKTGEWYISETDLDFIGEGCGILGTGGGGSVYSALLHSRETLRSLPRRRMRVVESCRLPPEARVAMIAFAGAPSVSNERLIGGDELSTASEALSRFLGISGYDAMMAAEIGGSNGMRTFASAAAMDMPIIDADTMGRAFPRVDMALPYSFGEASPAPAVLSDARGNVQVIAQVEDSHRFETVIRSACVELGLYTALSLAPLPRNVVDRTCCLGGLSFAWFMGRAICLSRQRKEDPTKALLGVIPGGKLLYTGKVIDVKREIKGGWTIGTATLEPFTDEDEDIVVCGDERQLVLSYQNEFFSAQLRDPAGSMPNKMLCITPDLITVIDSHSGTALATHELRYGLRVAVLGMPAHPLWLTEAGLKAGGPSAFGLEDSYEPIGTEWKEPPSVFRTYKQ